MITDDEARHLVAVRVIHEYYGVPVRVAMEWRSSGRNLRAIMADEYTKRRGKSGSNSHRPKHAGKGHSKNKR